jgi:hypothetical protein
MHYKIINLDLVKTFSQNEKLIKAENRWYKQHPGREKINIFIYQVRNKDNIRLEII